VICDKTLLFMGRTTTVFSFCYSFPIQMSKANESAITRPSKYTAYLLFRLSLFLFQVADFKPRGQRGIDIDVLKL
ncbi:MAG: hypothetical protein PVG84_17220, partial [Desulfobacterales bacterium]